MSYKNNIYTGTSNIVLPVSNKQHFPPDYQTKSRLCYYASLFNSLEVNSTFYKVPKPSTIQKWAADVPDDFKFTFKLWRQITHNKELAFNFSDLERFIHTINSIGDKKGCLLIQFPPSLQVNTKQLNLLLLAIIAVDNAREWRVAIEFRNCTWYREDIYKLLENYQMAMVIHDMPTSATPFIESGVPFVFLRFHGPNGGYRGSYTDDVLAEYASYINEWQEAGKNIYAYFNNTMGNAFQNVITLDQFIAI
ncbi:MAG: DUF72 domain-containing protein [Mucilaginibacter sp.]